MENEKIVKAVVKLLGDLDPDEVSQVLQDAVNDLGYTIDIS